MAEERRPRADGKGFRGPRSLYLRRCGHGFGFTLRHFIVYPPDSYTVLAGDRRLGLRPGALDEPMDTIFVKQVKPGSSAELAGLQKGDRVVSVNGETVSGHSYASVVHQIYNSGPCLHLLVVPQQDDILQLYFNDTAHRPESNLDSVIEPPLMVRSSRAMQWEAGSRRTSDTYSMTPTDSNESIPAVTPGCRLSLEAGMMGQQEPHSHEGSASSLGDHSSDDSIIISRIRKSCEQKEEFLKRPAGPVWPFAGGPPQGIKEFYARPQKLQPHPHWPPNLPASPNHSPVRQERDYTPPRDRGSVCGHVERRPRPGFVNTLGRIHETSQANPHPPQLQVVLQRAKQFESGKVPDRTNLYRSELARLGNKRMVPDVTLRAKQYESKSDRQSRESRSLDSTNNAVQTSSLSGNRLVPVGGRKVHCEPPTNHHHLSYEERPRSNSVESSWPSDTSSQRNKAVRQEESSWPSEPSSQRNNAVRHEESSWLSDSSSQRNKAVRQEESLPSDPSSQRSKAVRQDSYLAACHKPGPTHTEAANGLAIGVTEVAAGVTPNHILPPRPTRPTTLHIRPSVLLEIPCPSSLLRDSAGSGLTDGSGTEDSSGTPLDSPGVVWREKPHNDTVSEEERATRRVSYLKATWPDRMNVDSDPEASDLEQHPVSVVGPRHSVCEDLPDKENQQGTHEGSLHCKLTLVENKRAADRSWKQVWAVLRGPLLHLYKERRDSCPPSETPMAVEQLDVRCLQQVAPAQDYTKRRHVLRLNTQSGTELLLQAADDGEMARWIDTLKEQANNNNSNSLQLQDSSLSPPSVPARKVTSLRNRSPTGQSPMIKTRKPSNQVTVEPLASPKNKTWKGRVAKQFRRMQHSGGSPVSPTSPVPMVYPEGATIGVPLELCPPSSVSEYVPLLVELFTGIVEEKGLDVIGIYRVPGNTAAVSSLTEAANRGLDSALLDQDQRWRDVNVISSLLKSFFRRLPNSLFTSELYPSFIQADKIADPHLRMATIRKLVHGLPDHHYETLKYLLMHLKKVVEHSAMNKMEARNLAIVFGPTLVRTADDNMITMVTDMSHQCRIVETLIQHVDWCFGDEAVERLSLEGEVSAAEPDPAVANHNLLLDNIHKVEGMSKELSARDIVSSIICAANRKMMKSKSRKTPVSDDVSDHCLQSKQVVIEQVLQRLENKSQAERRKERLGNSEDSTDSSILSVACQSPNHSDSVAEMKEESAWPQTENGTIRTYAGLSATTQERIRKFELETKAMLLRDSMRSRRLEPDSEREQSKRELETEDTVNPSAIVKKIAEPGRAGKPLAIVTPTTTGRGRLKDEGLRRGTSVENVNQPLEEDPVMANLKRFKSAKDQGDTGLGRCGSLDSLHDLAPSECPPSHFSEEGGDLLVSIMSTFDAKLPSRQSSATSESSSTSPLPTFTDPSLHKACDKEDKDKESKEECCDEKSSSVNFTLELKKELENIDPRIVNLFRSESINREEQTSSRSESLSKSDSFKLRRSESLNKEARSEPTSKLKRSDSLTKTEKTESNLNKRRQLEAGRWNMVKLKRKTGSAIDRSIKRRHTVGGTKDFDKVHWLDNRQREAEEEGKKGRRTSSPDLSCSRASTVVILRPHSFAEPQLRLRSVPLESHV